MFKTYTLLIAGLLAGCAQPKDEMRMTSQDAMPATTLETETLAYDPTVLEVAPPQQMPVQPTMESTPVSQAAPAVTQIISDLSSARIHTVQPRDTLYGLARLYYNDARQWRRIYEANRERISDPNMIKIGMKLIIP